MDKISGIVMKITEEKLVLLCDDGKFRNIAHPQEMPALGDKIELPVITAQEEAATQHAKHAKRKWFVNHKYWSLAASLFVLFGIVMLVRMVLVGASPVAIVAVDINPGVELAVDRHSMVTDVTLMNDDAELLLQEDDLIGTPIVDALQFIITKAESQGYLNASGDNRYIFIAVHDLKPTASITLDPIEIVGESQPFEVEVYSVTDEQASQAKQTGLSMNKYVVYEQAQEHGVKLDVEQLRKQSIVKSVAEAGMKPDELIKKVREAAKERANKPSVAENSNKGNHEKRSDEKRSDHNRSNDKRNDVKRSDEKRFDKNRSNDKRNDGKRSDEKNVKRSDDNRSKDRQTPDRGRSDQVSDGKNRSDNKSESKGKSNGNNGMNKDKGTNNGKNINNGNKRDNQDQDTKNRNNNTIKKDDSKSDHQDRTGKNGKGNPNSKRNE